MKKTLAFLSLAAVLFTATPALAHDGGKKGEDNGRHMGWFKNWHRGLAADKFILNGSVVSATATSLVVTVDNSQHVGNIVNNQTTVVLNADTKITGKDKSVFTFSNLVAGDKVSVSGNVSGSVYTATQVWDMTRPATKAVGKVTAKTATSVTITNGVTNQSTTVTTDADTKVMINGETKTVADIAVGDSGWVKFKNVTGTMVAKVIHLFR